VVRGIKLERVFGYGDTEGEPLYERLELGYVTGDTPEGAWEALAALVSGHGYLGGWTDGDPDTITAAQAAIHAAARALLADLETTRDQESEDVSA
jgi:hypothetical protein